MWSYATAIAALFGAFAVFGVDSVVVREITRRPEHSPVILGSAFVLRLAAGGVAFAGAVATAALVRPGDADLRALVSLNAIAFVLQSAHVVDYYFQAVMKPRISVLAVNAAFLLASCGRLLLLWMEAPLLWFGASLAIEAALASWFLYFVYESAAFQKTSWAFDVRELRFLIKESWPLMMSGIAVVIYIRIDQLMLGQLLDDRAVGIYSAAVRIAEGWYFVPVAIVAATFPTIVAARKADQDYVARFQYLSDVLTALAIVSAMTLSLTSGWLVEMLFGPEYSRSAPVLGVLTWTGLFVSLGVASSSILIAEGLQWMSLIRTAVGCSINVALNLLLIPHFFEMGAALATLVAQCFAAVLILGLHSKTRWMCRCFLNSANPLGIAYRMRDRLNNKFEGRP